MRLLWLLFILHSGFAQPGFGRSYLRNSRLCHQWNCVNTKLGLQDTLPVKEDFTRVLRTLLPSGSWQDVVETVVETCYHNRSRRYTNTCPGQAIMHCAVDELNKNCPEESLRKNDACAPINSLAGFGYMFTQSRYENLETNLPLESRPSWFLQNYFDTKCCNIPAIINSTVLSECGFTAMLATYTHKPNFDRRVVSPSQKRDDVQKQDDGNHLKVSTLSGSRTSLTDPLDCCNISAFIQPSWRQECGFKVTWEGLKRLVIDNQGATTTTEVPTTTTTARPLMHRDLIVLPQTCEKENCVFKALGIVNDSGSVDMEAFTKFLDNFTEIHPQWNKAKGRVLTTCLKKPLTSYEADCDINKVLACTLDVLTENCPNTTKPDECKHAKHDRICQISSSKYRPKHRRGTCFVPDLVNKTVLSTCGMTSLTRIEQINMAAVQPFRKYRLYYRKTCQDLTPSTSCLLTKMAVLNKYGFMDYFKMKDRIRQFTQNEWANLTEGYLSAFTSMPLYSEHCNSPKKILNIIDSILLTCPASQRSQSTECSNLFNEIQQTPTFNQNNQKQNIEEILKHYQHVFFPGPVSRPSNIQSRITKKIIKKPIYTYGLLNSKDAPKVEIIDVKPKEEKRPLILKPVYMRIPINFMFKPSHISRNFAWQK